MAWKNEQEATLRRMWGEGATAAVIAERLRVSRSAVIGKAHRLGLAARPNPILETIPEKFKRLIDLVADSDAEVPLAAKTVGLDPVLAGRMWREMAAKFGRQNA